MEYCPLVPYTMVARLVQRIVDNNKTSFPMTDIYIYLAYQFTKNSS